MKMKMKNIIVGLMIVVVMLSHMEKVEPSAADCYDACSTACVQPNKIFIFTNTARLMQRCDRKCQIRCQPASQVEGNPGLV
ncbi:Thionin-like protein [Melia azedarach]|uniref:Thionin-like protein n=1 Tax=Melia azedarach TaxID=155640 RepID=A0ACC1YRP1_MELAZ|nr:Thionin-like protein [Melia azedarach]